MKDNQLKIGKTTRTPEIRAKEISRGTGVPLPFEVAHFREFDNCHEAEKKIHAQLKEFRVNSDREFFQIPLFKAIKIIDDLAFSELKEKLAQIEKSNQSSKHSLKEDIEDVEDEDEMELVFLLNLRNEILDDKLSWNKFLKFINLLTLFEFETSYPPDVIHENYEIYEDEEEIEYRIKNNSLLFTKKKLRLKDDLIKNKLSSLLNILRKDKNYHDKKNLKNGYIDNYIIINEENAYFFDFATLYKILHQTDWKIKNAGTYKASIRKIADKVDISPVSVLSLDEYSAYDLIRKLNLKEPSQVLDINELLSKFHFELFLGYFLQVFSEEKEAALFEDNKYLYYIVFNIIIMGKQSEFIHLEDEKYHFKYGEYYYDLNQERIVDLFNTKKALNGKTIKDVIKANELVYNYVENTYEFKE